MYCFIYRILQIKTVAQCMNNMSLLNVVVKNSVFVMSIDKHVHFEMDIAKRPDAQKTKTKLYIFFFFSCRIHLQRTLSNRHSTAVTYMYKTNSLPE